MAISQAKRQRMKRQRERLEAAAKELGEQANIDPTKPADMVLMERAVRNGWLEPGEMQRFETRTAQIDLVRRIESSPSQASIMELVALSVLTGLRSGDMARRSAAEKVAVQMERANQRDDELRAMQEMRSQTDGTGEVKALDWDSMYESQSSESATALRELEESEGE